MTTEKLTFAIGDRVDQMCATCGEERGHIVASATKKGRPTRVTCAVCGSRVRFTGNGARVGGATKSGAPYDQKQTYRRGQTLTHPTFGVGEVTAIIEPRKMDVLFADRVRRLIHANAPR